MSDLAAMLPPLPDRPWDEGYDWICQLTGGWQPIPSWGRDGCLVVTGLRGLDLNQRPPAYEAGELPELLYPA